MMYGTPFKGKKHWVTCKCLSITEKLRPLSWYRLNMISGADPASKGRRQDSTAPAASFAAVLSGRLTMLPYGAKDPSSAISQRSTTCFALIASILSISSQYTEGPVRGGFLTDRQRKHQEIENNEGNQTTISGHASIS